MVAAIPAALEAVDELARLLGGQDYMAGPALSLADLMLIPHLAFMPAFASGIGRKDRTPKNTAVIVFFFIAPLTRKRREGRNAHFRTLT